MRRPENKEIAKAIVKTSIISGSMMIVNDEAYNVQIGKSSSPLAKILKNIASNAIGYAVGKKAADVVWNAIDNAIQKYNEGV